MTSNMLRTCPGNGVLTCIPSKKDLQALTVIALRDAKIRVPLAVDKNLVDLDLVLLADSAQGAVDQLIRVDGTRGELVDREMHREGIAPVLIDQKPSVDGKPMPKASAVELARELLRFEMNEV